MKEINLSVNELFMKFIDGSGIFISFKEKLLELKNKINEVLGNIEKMYDEKEDKILEVIKVGGVVKEVFKMVEVILDIVE